MLDEDLDRIARCLHPDPHTILGPHESEQGTRVRVLRPGAASVRLLVGDRAVPARPMRSAGLFEGTLDAQGDAYRIETTAADGAQTIDHDPYAFPPTIGELDLQLFAEGKHHALYEHLGAHPTEQRGIAGTSFAVWAPAALSVRVIGDFNGWEPALGAMRKLTGGVWEIFVPGVGEGALYKFEVMTRRGPIAKSDPFARSMELRPGTACRVHRSHHSFGDEAWMRERAEKKWLRQPVSIYEVHLPSWKLKPASEAAAEGEGASGAERWLTYRELAHELVDYVADLGFSHIELLPVLEHPYDGSWGYQVSGYFAPTSRLGTPDDFAYFVDRCHARGIGVILDWVPAHFPKDSSALGRFDGTPLFEHWDPRRGEHRQWETLVFDWGRPQVKNFLIASALYWLKELHLDGLRVDAVASMLYLDYAANDPSEWEPNIHGGRENLEAVAFLKELNEVVHLNCPGVLVCAEESTSWPAATKPTYAGGLGFDLKWNMGWMHDTLDYVACDPVFRAYHHTKLTFGMMYAYSEQYLLPFSHDEVVHLKRSLLEKIPGDDWQKRATLRALYGYMWAHPGKKLLFMGGELGQRTEWNFSTELDWHVLDRPGHRAIQNLIRRLNALHRQYAALAELDHHPRGFSWIDANDAPQSVASFIRFPSSTLHARQTGEFVVFVGNFTPVVRHGYRLGVPRSCDYLEVLNTDAAEYGGSNCGNMGGVKSEPVASHGHAQSIRLTLPPLGALYLVPADAAPASDEELAEEARYRAARAKARETDPDGVPSDPGVR